MRELDASLRIGELRVPWVARPQERAPRPAQAVAWLRELEAKQAWAPMAGQEATKVKMSSFAGAISKPRAWWANLPWKDLSCATRPGSLRYALVESQSPGELQLVFRLSRASKARSSPQRTTSIQSSTSARQGGVSLRYSKQPRRVQRATVGPAPQTTSGGQSRRGR